MSERVATFKNGTILIKREDGSYDKIVPNAQAKPQDQTQPQSVEDDVDAGVPRDKSVGLDQTDAEYQEYSIKNNQPGTGGTDEKVVPRSKGDSGISGCEKTTFEKEKGEDITSGNPDSYFQDFTPSEKPTPAGNKENHTAKKVSKELEKIAELEKELEKEKIYRTRERIARKTVDLEIRAGLLDIDEDEIDAEVESRVEADTAESLEREYKRVQSLCNLVEQGRINAVAGKHEFAGIRTATENPTLVPSLVGLQSLSGVPSFYNKQMKYSTVIEGGVPSPMTKVASNWENLQSLPTTLSRLNQEIDKENK